MVTPPAQMTRAEMAERADAVAALLKTLSHPVRLVLVCTLVEGEYSVGALEEELGIHQPTLSQQLGVLRDAGIVETRREFAAGVLPARRGEGGKPRLRPARHLLPTRRALMIADYWLGLAGGLCIGASASLLMLVNGRVAGISGIFGRLISTGPFLENAAFVLGLLAGPALFLLAMGGWPEVTVAGSWPLLVVAGLLVGFGSRLGSGCTSGHGVVGLARLSRRSMVATAVFLGVAVVTATAMGLAS